MRVRSWLRGLMLAGAALSGVATGGAASAQTTSGSLDEALRAAARLSGREIIYPEDAVRGRPAPALDPAASPEEAVRALLRGTDLEAEFRPDVIVVRQRAAASDAEQARSVEAATVVVTATRIRGGDSSSPVRVTGRREIELQGARDLGDFARSVPQNFGGGQNPGIVGGGNQGNNININASSNFNLRGLGDDATLTLVNGHRVAYDGLTQGIDISAIPLAAISRVEIVTDSASALHGSDAVGGVVNVILRQDFDGLLTSARAGATLEGGFDQQRFSAVAGANWGSGGAMLAADYSRNGNVLYSQRDITASLDGSGTIYPWLSQASGVAAIHQRLGAFTIGGDAQYSHRVSEIRTPFLTSGGVRTFGLIPRPTVKFHAISPRIGVDLPAGWTANLTGTQSRSLSDLLSRRFIASAETTLRLRYDNRLLAGELGAEGPLATLPGGDMRLAIGAGARSLRLHVRNTSTFAGVTRVTSDLGGRRDVLFGYGELSIPLFGPENGGAFAQRLRVDLAARYEDYRGIGDVVSPKAGIIYEPVSGLTLKATWGRSFKAPTLFQEKQIRQGPLLPSSGFAGAPANRTVLLLAGGGNALGPERAESWSGTVELRASGSVTLSASYFDIRYRDRVAVPIGATSTALSDPRYASFVTLNPTAAQLAAVVATLPQGISNQTGAPYDPANVVAIVNNGLVNVARQRARGVDLALDYKAEIGRDRRVGVNASISYLESDQQALPGQTPIQRAGTVFDPPHWRGRLAATWEHRGLTLGGFASYIGENLDDRFTPNGTVGSFFTVDASAAVRWPSAHGALANLEVGLSFLNILNEMPMRIPTVTNIEPAYDSSNSSILGRTVSVTITKRW